MTDKRISRRQLMGSAAMTAGLAGAMAALPASARASESGKPALGRGDVVLIQGDSITDAGRDRRRENNPNDPLAMGRGYAFLLGCALLKDYPQLGLKVYNRGISGNKVPDLQNRWDKDCLQLKPAVLSILIGVNDIWHKMNGRYNGTVEDYRRQYTDLLKGTRQALPQVKIVVCEPFALRCGAVKDSWYPEFDRRRAVAKEVAAQAGAIFVPFQAMFDAAVAAGTPPQYWARDGVHPSMAGHALMTETWRKVTGI